MKAGVPSIGETTTISSPGTEAIREENLPILSETHSEEKTEEKPNEEPSLASLGITGDYDLGQLGILTDEVQDYKSSQISEVRHQNNSEILYWSFLHFLLAFILFCIFIVCLLCCFNSLLPFSSPKQRPQAPVGSFF